jgi:hypothetical protein
MMATLGLRSDAAYSCNMQGKQRITHYCVSLASFVVRVMLCCTAAGSIAVWPLNTLYLISSSSCKHYVRRASP